MKPKAVYVHEECGVVNYLSGLMAQKIERNPREFEVLRCSGCQGNFPISEFFWDGTEITVGD